MDILGMLGERVLLMDGAMGTMLQGAGLQPGENPALLNMRNPQAVRDVHLAYLQAGAGLILTNTFGANGHKLPGDNDVSAVVRRAVGIAREAAAQHATDTGEKEALVALNIGPIGELLEPSGMLGFDQAYALFQEQVVAGAAAGADVIYIETMSDLLEAKCAVLAAKEHSNLPVFCTMSFEQGGRTFMGVSIAAMALTLHGLGVDCVGLNCSVGPEEIAPMVQELIRWTDCPIIAKPNAGMPLIENGQTVFASTPESFAHAVAALLELGVSAVGGCCGTTPDYIRKLSKLAQNKKPSKREPVGVSAVCSATKVVRIKQVTVIGERINPSGKKDLQKALLAGDMDVVVDEAMEQAEVGADVLDVNVFVPDTNEALLMAGAVRAIQAAARVPLAIDSANYAALEAGLRAYNGKPILNSVTGSDESLNTLLPLAKKYGAAVIGLTMDEQGVPRTAEARVRVAQKILNAAQEQGIPSRDVYIDCLTLPSCAEQEIVSEALVATERMKRELEVNTVLGISNISYGLPGRAKLNQAYLLMALERGLDMPILDPTVPEMMDAVCCFCQLKNMDEDSADYVAWMKAKLEEASEEEVKNQLSL
ncbi:MAG: homocysteine S-methyltransferase family protein [Clostridia bacterium]|nr:homocysteine S-methyltransferase family protein [Clostridia bacterium]